jgi:hypothetical protein
MRPLPRAPPFPRLRDVVLCPSVRLAVVVARPHLHAICHVCVGLFYVLARHQLDT